MRVVLAGSSYLCDGGGIAAYNRELSKVLVEVGHQVVVITTDSLGDTDKWPVDCPRLALFQTTIPKRVKDEVGIAKQMFDKVVEFDPDVLISSDHIYLTSLFPCFADRRIRISICHSTKGVWPWSSACRPSATDWIVVLSQAAREVVTKLKGVLKNQVIVVYTGIRDQIEVSESIRKKRDNVSLNIIYPGGKNRIKRPAVMLKLIRELSATTLDWYCTWIGNPGRFPQQIPKDVRERVLFIGKIPRREVEQRLLAAHCFILPSRFEGCPMSLLEAMRAGAIPLVSDCPSAMRELVAHGISGYIIPRKNSKRLLKHVIDIGTSPHLRRDLMNGARAAFEEKLTAEKWLINMTRLMKNRRAGRAVSSRKDEFKPGTVFRWHRRRGSWKRPTVSYLRYKFGYPNLSPITKA